MSCCRNCCKTLLWLGLAALLVCPWVIEAGHRGDVEEIQTLEGSSGFSEFELEVVASTHWAALTFHPSLDAGRLFVELVDPAGKAHAWGQFEASGSEGALKWREEEPAAGQWTLRVNREEASGKYRFEWKAR